MTDLALPTPRTAGRDRSLGDFLFAVKQAQADPDYWHGYLTERYNAVKTPLAEASGATGGYLIPTEYNAGIVNVAAPLSIVRPRALVIPMSSRTLTLPYLDQTVTPAAGTSALIGNVALAWQGEGVITETEPVFRAVELAASKLTALSIGSRELDEDSLPTMEVIMTQLFGRAVAWYEDATGIAGTGVGQPLGITNAPCTYGVTRGTVSAFKQPDVGAMLGHLHPNSLNNGMAVWVIHPTVVPQVVTMTGTVPSDPLRLGGLPVKVSEHCSPLGTPGDVLLADFSHYLLGDRHMMSVAVSPHPRFNSDQDVYRVTHRIAGQPWLSAPVTLKDGVTQVSPFVRLV